MAVAIARPDAQCEAETGSGLGRAARHPRGDPARPSEIHAADDISDLPAKVFPNGSEPREPGLASGWVRSSGVPIGGF